MNKTIVFIHGAFHGGWCWERVTSRLAGGAYQLVTPSLIGCAERLAEITAVQGVDTYVDDMCGFLTREVPGDWVLVGHSFGGRVISGIADRHPDRVQQIIYFDGAIPIPGQTSPAIAFMSGQPMAEVHGVRCITPREASWLNIENSDDAAWVKRNLTPMPISAYETVMTLRHPLGNGRPATYIRCTKPESPGLKDSIAYVTAQGFPIIDFRGGHDGMISAPAALADLLRELT